MQRHGGMPVVRCLSGASCVLNDVLDEVCGIQQHGVLCLRLNLAQHDKPDVPVF